MNADHRILPDEVDAVVIGSGPAGSTAAMRLADEGRSILLLERRKLPRFHIGESQLTYSAEILRQLGILEEVAAEGYPVKTGAEFITTTGDFRRTDFADVGPGRQSTTFQVERAHFDALLARKAGERGARLVQDALVRDFRYDEDGRVSGVHCEVDGVTHTIRAEWVIDAGGRASKAAKTFRTRTEISWLRNVAVYRHFRGLDERHNPAVTGDIQIGGHRDGWVWAIPIWPDTISIGAVMPAGVLREASDPAELLDEHIARVPRVRARITGTTPDPQAHVESDYCYYSDVLTGPGWIMAGDAGSFIDPIFSGGAFLAMATGREAARTVDAMISRPRTTPELQKSYSDFYKTGYDSYTRLISAYYESEYQLGKYLLQRGFSVDGDTWFARILSGDFWSDLNPLNNWLREQRRWDTFAAFDTVGNCPIYPELDAAERAEVSADAAVPG